MGVCRTPVRCRSHDFPANPGLLGRQLREVGMVARGMIVGLLMLTPWGAWSLGSPVHSTALPVLEPTAISVQDGQSAVIDLSGGEHGSTYLVILGSLAVHDSANTVRITSAPVPNAQPIPRAASRIDGKWLASVSTKRQQMRARRALARQDGKRHVAARFPERKSFFVFVKEDDFFDRDGYHEVIGQLVAVGEECLVYVDLQDNPESFARDVIDEIVETFDHTVHPKARELFGRHHDVDRNGKFTILLTHCLGNLSNGKVSLGGFVRGSDFLQDLAPPFSNQCDMMYLNSNVRPGEHLRTLIAHEYTHAITYSEHVFGDYLVGGGGEDEETWLGEAMAHLAENFAGTGWSNLDYRISTYLNAPQRYRLVVPDYYRSGLWRCHGSRGSTYLFLRWCVDRYGPELLEELSRSGLVGVENLEVATQTPFAELFRAWSVAMCVAGVDTRSEGGNGLEYLSLHGRLASRLLAGARMRTLEGEHHECPLMSSSWIPLVVRIPAGKTARYGFDASPNTKLQVTLLRLPDDYPSAKVDLAPTTSLEGSTAKIAMKLEHQSGCAVVWQRMTLEPAYMPQTKSSLANFVPKVVVLEEVIDGTRTEPGDTIQASELAPPTDFAGELVVKIHGVDARGRDVSAWGSIYHANDSPAWLPPRVIARDTDVTAPSLSR